MKNSNLKLFKAIHPSRLFSMSFWWEYLFIFHHAPSVWTHGSLRLWWQQLLSIFNWLLWLLCLLPTSWIMLWCISWKHLACIPACSQLFYPLFSRKWLLSLSTLLSVKHLMQTKFRPESEILLKKHLSYSPWSYLMPQL